MENRASKLKRGCGEAANRNSLEMAELLAGQTQTFRPRAELRWAWGGAHPSWRRLTGGLCSRRMGEGARAGYLARAGEGTGSGRVGDWEG